MFLDICVENIKEGEQMIIIETCPKCGHGLHDQSACNNCPNNPKNGGGGNCSCTLEQMNIVY